MKTTEIVGKIWRSPFYRLFSYFLVVALLAWSLIHSFPMLSDAFLLIKEDAAEGISDLPLGGNAPGFWRWAGDFHGIEGSILMILLAMVSGIIFVIPVAWVYTVTRTRQEYDKAVVQMIIILPIAVTGVVLVVFGDLALAFALAGIVAAVRFRTTLDDVKDAVFAFVAIGIGLAAGVQAFLVAGGLAFVFSLVILVLWRLKIGNFYADLEHTGKRVSLSEAMAPDGENNGGIVLGNRELVDALSHEELERVAERASRLDRRILANADEK